MALKKEESNTIAEWVINQAMKDLKSINDKITSLQTDLNDIKTDFLVFKKETKIKISFYSTLSGSLAAILTSLAIYISKSL